MYVLQYIYNDKDVSEEYTFNSYALSVWKKKELIRLGQHTLGKFRIKKI
jgi:hypothetical protein